MLNFHKGQKTTTKVASAIISRSESVKCSAGLILAWHGTTWSLNAIRMQRLNAITVTNWHRALTVNCSRPSTFSPHFPSLWYLYLYTLGTSPSRGFALAAGFLAMDLATDAGLFKTFLPGFSFFVSSSCGDSSGISAFSSSSPLPCEVLSVFPFFFTGFVLLAASFGVADDFAFALALPLPFAFAFGWTGSFVSRPSSDSSVTSSAGIPSQEGGKRSRHWRDGPKKDRNILCGLSLWGQDSSRESTNDRLNPPQLQRINFQFQNSKNTSTKSPNSQSSEPNLFGTTSAAGTSATILRFGPLQKSPPWSWCQKKQNQSFTALWASMERRMVSHIFGLIGVSNAGTFLTSFTWTKKNNMLPFLAELLKTKWLMISTCLPQNLAKWVGGASQLVEASSERCTHCRIPTLHEVRSRIQRLGFKHIHLGARRHAVPEWQVVAILSHANPKHAGFWNKLFIARNIMSFQNSTLAVEKCR